MSAEQDPDVIIVGTGQAGAPLATRLVAAGKRVLIVERGHVGGTCVNVGCTPTKTLVASARAAHVARTAGRLGVHVGELKLDFAAIMARKGGMVARWRAGVEKHLTGGGEKLRLVRGHARFVGARTIEVNGERYQAEQVVINVGARSARPELAGLDSVPYLDSSSSASTPRKSRAPKAASSSGWRRPTAAQGSAARISWSRRGALRIRMTSAATRATSRSTLRRT